MSESPKPQLPGAIRWLHTYLSLIGFAAVLFFAVTGLTLNHAEWFETGGGRERTLNGTVPPQFLPANAEADLAGLQEWLRGEFGLHGSVDDADADEQRCRVLFKAPGYSAEATIDIAARTAQVHETRLNSWALLDDLHKGRDSGALWSWVIDICAIVVAISALTGLWLLFYVKRRRRAGFLVAAVGLVVLVLVGWIWTP